MKTRFLRKAKSALSILLTLCVLISCMSLGISSADAATAKKRTGITSNGSNCYIYVSTQYAQYSNNSSAAEWGNGCYFVAVFRDSNDTYSTESTHVSGTFVKNINGSNASGGQIYRFSVPNGTWSYVRLFRGSGTSWDNKYNETGKIALVANSSSNNMLTYFKEGADGTTSNWESSYQYDSTGSLSASPTSIKDNETATLSPSITTNTNVNVYKSVSYSISPSSGASISGNTFTPTTTGSFTVTATITYNAKGFTNITKTATANTTITVSSHIITLNTPTNVKINNASSYAVDTGASSTTTLTWTGDSRASGYDIYKGNTKVGSTTGANSTSYTISNTTSSAGTYYVMATTTNTSTYANSAKSTSSATLTVYSPEYCLVGNDIRDEAFLINGETPSTTNPTGTATWFNTWQESFAIKNPTGTPGIYSITFTVRDDYEWSPDVEIYQKTGSSSGVQRGFILNGSAYNISSHGDITVTDDGIDWSANLYAYPTGTPVGGALLLKKGQTYTITIDQTQRYNSSSPYGKIKVETGDIFAETAAKKQSFNATNRSYDAVSDADTSVGTASSSPVHGPKNSLTTTLTATVVNSDYEFIGWYTSAACSGTPTIAASVCTNSGSTYTKSVTISASTTYYALFKQKTPEEYTASLVQTSFGTISITGGASGSGNSYTAYRGATVSINATTSDNSKTFSRWVITNASNNADITSTVCASPSQATTTFTMPAQNVSITAVYANKTPINITVTSNNTSLGTATYTSGSYYVGDSIPITATPTSGLNGGVFVKWVVTGGLVTNANAASTTITQTGATVTARAVFENKTFQLFSDKDISGNTTNAMYTMVRMSDGRYVSTRTVTKSTGSFTIYDVKDAKYARPSTTQDYEMHSGYTSNNINSWSTSSYKYKIKSTDSASYYVIFDPRSGQGTISITTTNPLGTIAQIYAKDGSIRYSAEGSTSGDLWEKDGGGTTANRGVTVVTQINSTSVPNPDTKRYPSTNPTLNEHLKQYSAAIGNTITIQTTMNSTYQTRGFYVGMFVINGWKVEATDVGNGKYTATFTLSDEYSVNNLDGAKSFEITPVYYNKNFEYVTFYVDAASVPSKWGKTISACADYNGATDAHFEGTYPGQPLGREGDLYEIKVSRAYYDYSSSTGKWTRHTNYQPSVTITAYNYDNVHHYYYVEADDTLNTGNKNYQTYDFSDFNYLAKINDIESILFRCKYETSKNNWRIYASSDSSAPTANYNATDPTWWAVDDHKSLLNNFQVLTDYYGNPIDALGNRIIKSGTTYYTADDVSSLLTDFSTSPTSKVRIVSYGNRNTNTDTANSRTAAQWATGWAVFQGGADGTNRKIAYGNPADFICTTPGTASTANVHYLNGKNASALTGKITYITYDNEKTNSISGVGDTGERIDGQWYYSAMHEFDSNVKVAVTTSETSAVTTSNTTIEVDSNSANNTGYTGTTSKTKATLDGETTHTYSNVTTDAELKATVGSGYTFVGWYLYDGSTYTKIHDNFADVNTTMTMKKNYTIVAVVREVGEGDLVITHSRYTGNSPEAHDGTGKYYVSAVVRHSNDSTTEYAEALNSITIPGVQATDKITISIRTVCNGVDTFYGWYEEALGDDYSRTGEYYEICNETDDPLGETEVSYTFFEADCSTFFNGTTLERNTIDLYSDIVHVSAFATLTYKYYDRFETNGKNQMVSYTVKNVPLDNDEIAAGFIPSDETISRYAPNVVDTIYSDTKWNIIGNKVERAASNITLMATQSTKDCYVQYIPNQDVAELLLQSLNNETTVQNIPEWTNKTVKFNSWLTLDSSEATMENYDPSDFIVSAPESYTYQSGNNSTTWNFERFDVYSYNRTSGEIGSLLYSVNDSIFGYRIYTDCVIYPVYTNGDSSKELTANIEPAVLNREVYGDSVSPTDKLYADLIVSFINTKSIIGTAQINDFDYDSNTKTSQGVFNGVSYTVETGVILDRGVNLSDSDYNTLKEAGAQAGADGTQSIINNTSGANYPAKFNSAATIATGLVNENITFGSAATYGNDVSHNYIKYMNNNSLLTDKNRLDKVVIFTNNEKAQKAVLAAYSYIIITNASTGAKTVAVSNPQLFNFAYVGNKPLTS